MVIYNINKLKIGNNILRRKLQHSSSFSERKSELMSW